MAPGVRGNRVLSVRGLNRALNALGSSPGDHGIRGAADLAVPGPARGPDPSCNGDAACRTTAAPLSIGN